LTLHRVQAPSRSTSSSGSSFAHLYGLGGRSGAGGLAKRAVRSGVHAVFSGSTAVLQLRNTHHHGLRGHRAVAPGRSQRSPSLKPSSALFPATLLARLVFLGAGRTASLWIAGPDRRRSDEDARASTVLRTVILSVAVLRTLNTQQVACGHAGRSHDGTHTAAEFLVILARILRRRHSRAPNAAQGGNRIPPGKSARCPPEHCAERER